jgi:hypothetical protein
LSKEDASIIILRELSSGPKTPEELKEACCERAGIVESTYYYHLKQLIEKLRELEEISERDSNRRVIIKYALRKEKPKPDTFRWFAAPGGLCAFEVDGHEVPYPPNRSLAELAAWIRHHPEGWNIDNNNVKNAKLCLEHINYFIPAIEEASEDPDLYAFVWPDESLRKIDLGSFSFSRFFDYKGVYDAVQVGMKINSMSNGAVFLGAFCSKKGDDPMSVIVAVRKEGSHIDVMQVERRLGELDKAWVKGVSNHLQAKNEFVLSEEKLKDSVKREVLLTLRDTFDKNVLSIPNKYTQLVEELFDFSYGGPTSGYVLALALAVQRANKN